MHDAWKPISSVPRDPKVVVDIWIPIVRGDLLTGRITECVWFDDGLSRGWRSRLMNGLHYIPAHEPTHWCYPPAPPA